MQIAQLMRERSKQKCVFVLCVAGNAPCLHVCEISTNVFRDVNQPTAVLSKQC